MRRRIRPQPFLGDPWTQRTVLGIIGFNNLNSPGPCLKRYFGKILAWALKGGDGLFAQGSLDCRCELCPWGGHLAFPRTSCLP